MPRAADWNAEDPAIWQERTGSGAAARAITLRHPTYPFTADWSPATGRQLQTIAASYLHKVRGLLGLHGVDIVDGRSFVTSTSGIIPLTWLSISDGGENALDLARSLWIRRRDPSRVFDRTAILFAVQTLKDNDDAQALGSRLGIRIVAHVSMDEQPKVPTVRITGATCSTDLPAQLALGSPAPLGTIFSPFHFFDVAMRDNVRTIVRNAAGLGDVPLAFSGLRVRAEVGKLSFEIYMTAGRAPDRPETPSHAVTVRIPADGGLDEATVEAVPLFSHCADVTAKLFRQDPASEAGDFMPRPDCGPEVLEPYRYDVTLPGLYSTELKDDLDQVSVMQSRLAGRLPTSSMLDEAEAGEEEINQEEVNETEPERGDIANIPHARTNLFAAASGYQHARELFDKMRSYGLPPEDYFRRAALPLHVRYRAGVPPGPGKDGKTVNARVDFDPPNKDIESVIGAADLNPLQVLYALADVQRSGSKREPLGITADPRWSWHEFSHVLIAAATGALELPFVHSTGDALAAILSDPASNLAHPDKTKVPWSWRMATFPWVYLNRRHDRAVHEGWSWCGSRHRQARFTSGSAFLLKGYDSEQILSTTLFRLYRSLGGDTFADQSMRQSAADYTAYLIMRAIAWLGPINWAPAETPDQLVSALVDADIATAPVPAPIAKPTPAFPERVGGCAHKVVRWAFEAQGLYATTDPQEVVNAPGQPPTVDIFIDDRRPACKPVDADDPAYTAGAYIPVPLDWEPVLPGSPDAPAWHATEQAIRIDGAGDLWVTVRNRGRMGAAGVVVAIWHAAPGANDEAPAWNSGGWTPLGATQPGAVGPNASATFGPVSGLPAGRPRFILAAATCPADLANINPATELPCVAGAPIVDLVAGDNNLGLRLLPVP